MPRESDMDTPNHLELGHVYDRLKKLEEGQNEVQKTLTAVQLKLAEGPRFPGWLPVVMVSILLFLAGQTTLGLIWGGGINAQVADLPDLKGRLTSAFQGMRTDDERILSVEKESLRIRQELDTIQKRTVEGTDDRWRRRDDEARMADLQKYLDAMFARVNARLDKEEKRSEERDKLWQQLLVKGSTKADK